MTVLNWAEKKLEVALDQVSDTDCWDGTTSQSPVDELHGGASHYRFHLLQDPDNDTEVVGARRRRTE